jgi:uncharacterized membrane protein SpoIIM required for sporulation
MAEPITRFVARRRPDWDALQSLLERQKSGQLALDDLRRLDLLYRTTAADLAHAQAHYPGSDAHRFLNQLCATAYGAIYQPPRDRWGAARRFYAEGFPRALREAGWHVGASGALFALGLVAGALVVLLDPLGAELLVPAALRDYVARGELWTKDFFSVTPPGVAATGIATNNLSVTIAAFGLGLTAGVGTVFILLNNGLHLGAVAALCAREGMGPALLDFVGAHGPVELSIIVIAGGAGLLLGHALVDPGELPRAQALRNKGLLAVKLVVGCAPFLFAIGIVEGYVSPAPLGLGFKLALGAALVAVFWGYLLRAGRRVTGRAGAFEGSAGAARRSW